MMIRFTLLFCCLCSWAITAEQPIVYREEAAQIIIPACPLTSDSWSVESIPQHPHLYLWTHAQHANAYQLLQKIARVWKNQGVQAYMIGGQDQLDQESSPFEWQFVPYDARSWGLSFRHISVLWNTTFGPACLSLGERLEKAKHDQQFADLLGEPLVPQVQDNPKGTDVFCNPEVIARQEIYQGKYVRLLYNYAPIGPDKQHFLIVPIAHRENFNTLTLDEYVEAMQIASVLLKHYRGPHYSLAYLFHKTGAAAGQTVFHWHMHVLFLNGNAQGVSWFASVLKNMAVGASPIPPDELEKRVQEYRQELVPLFSNPSSPVKI